MKRDQTGPILAAINAGRSSQAELLARVLIKREARNPEAYHLAGVACYLQKKFAEAEKLLRQALKLRSDAGYYLNLALTLKELGKEESAIEAYRDTLRLDPGNVQAANNLANIMVGFGQMSEAETLYREIVARSPNYALGHKNLGGLLRKTGRYDEAEAALRKALELSPGLADAKSELGVVFERKKAFGAAAELYRQLKDWNQLQRMRRMNADWRDLPEIDRLALKAVETGQVTEPWGLIGIPDLTPDLHRLAGETFARSKWGKAFDSQPLAPVKQAATDRLTIGYLSNDFFDHATMHLLMGVLEAHDRKQFDIRLFSYAPPRDDRFTQRLARSGLPFHDVRSMPDDAAAKLIASQGVDILVDLKGYTTGARLEICAKRPAPIVVSWLGYPGSLGHPRLADFIIGDKVVTPPEHAAHYSETLALMPNCYQPNDRDRQMSARPERGKAGLPEQGFVFCSFNQTMKINQEMFGLWCRLLRETPDSVLWLLDNGSSEATDNLRQEAVARQVDPQRLVFAPFVSQEEHLGRLQLADLALDTWPCNSHTTASDALWAGVPMVTRPAETFAGRVGASLVTCHGFADLVVKDDESYFQLALALAHSPDELAKLRQRLEAARLSSPLFDTIRFTRDLERLYGAIWKRHCANPEDLTPIITGE